MRHGRNTGVGHIAQSWGDGWTPVQPYSITAGLHGSFRGVRMERVEAARDSARFATAFGCFT